MAQTIIVDISTRGANPVAYTHQGDTGRTFFAEIYENGEAFAVAGYTIKVGAILPADRGYTVIAGNDMVTATKTNDNTTNKIYFTLSDKYSLKAGNGILTLIFTSNTGTPSTIRPINIDLRIQKSADADDTIAGASDFPEGLEAIAEEVFQEYLSTYLPPVAPSASAAANKAADAKLTGEALDDLKSELNDGIARTYDNLREVPVTFIDGGYIDRDTGNVVEYSGWKYSDYIDLSGLTNSYFITLLTTTETSGSSYNTFYNENKEKIGNNFPSGINTLPQIPLYEGAKYIRISCRTADKYQIFDDTEKAPINFYRDDNVLISDFIPVSGIKYMLSTPVNTSIEQFDTGKNSIVFSPYTGSREYYKGNNVAYIQLRFLYSNYTKENVKAITFTAKDHFEPIHNFRVCSFNVGLWNNGVIKQPDAKMQEYAQNFRRFLGQINSEIICCLEAPTTGNVSGTYDVNKIFEFLYGYKHRFETGNSTGKIVHGKNTFLNPTEHTFTASGRNYYSFEYNVGSKLITVYLVHLSIEASTTGNRQADLQEIAGILATTSHCIVLGDWNTYDMSELDVLSAYNIANGGIFGKFITWPNVTETWPNGAIDNIVTTTDIVIKNVVVPDVTLSDHKPLIADISLY